jgi:TolA-binding protein
MSKIVVTSLIIISLGNPLLRAQDVASGAGQLWKSGRTAFFAGDYPTSAKDFDDLIHQAAPGPLKWSDNTTATPPPPIAAWLEPAFYMLGASYFNAKQYPEAIDTFNRYFRLFPNARRISEVRFSMAEAQFLSNHPLDAIPYFTQLLSIPTYHAKSILLIANSYQKAGKLTDAIALLEKERLLPNLSFGYLGKLNTKLLELYEANANLDQAVALLQQMDEDIAHLQDVTQFNTLAVRLGDNLLQKNDIAGALNCYRRVRDNAQIIAIEKLQIAALNTQLANNLALIQANPLNSDDLQVERRDLTAQLQTHEKILAATAKLPPILPPLFLRIGRAYFTTGHPWEAAVVYRELLRRFPDGPEAESALYGSIVIFDRVKRTNEAQALCQAYLTKYPQGKYVDSVGFLQGALAYDAQQYDQAITYFEDSIKDHPNNPRREQIEVILGDIKLRQQNFDGAIAAYAKYQSDFPHGEFLQQAQYRSALALLFGGKTEAANAAISAYIQKYPQGQYVPDAEYRLDVIQFGAKDYDKVIADGLAWQKKHGTNGPLAEVLSLMGDSYASLDRPDEALRAYTQSYKAAQTTEVLSYSISAAAKILQKEKKYQQIVQMFQDFIKDNPDSPYVVAAVSWIGRADVKLGKVDEAKQYMATTAKRYLNDPSREAVDEILTELAQLFGRKHLALAPPAPAAPTVPASTAAAPVSAPGALASGATPAAAPAVAAPSDPAQDLEDLLTIPDLDKKPTASARLIYAKSELARFQKKPQIEAQLLLDIADKFKPEDLSPAILGQVGDCLVQSGKPDQADAFYHEIIDEYDQSPLVDYAYNGLAQIAYDKKDYTKALGYYSTALDKGVAATKLKEITLGQAQTLLALDRYEEAKPLFEQVASNRAWRGEATALSVFSLGKIQMAQAKYAEANAFFQRVYVAYQKYPAIQAKAYLESGEAFEKLGKLTEAANTYREMLRNPNLTSFPEAQEATQRLNNLAQK